MNKVNQGREYRKRFRRMKIALPHERRIVVVAQGFAFDFVYCSIRFRRMKIA